MKAPDLIIDKWLNCPEGFGLDVHDGTIKVIHFFQMLCPGCVYHGVPQTHELYNKFNSERVQVVGVHSVFEHYDVMTPRALEVFISEFRLPFPVAIDSRHEEEKLPETMKAYELQGTPSLVVIDHKGEVQLNKLGHIKRESIERIVQELIDAAEAVSSDTD